MLEVLARRLRGMALIDRGRAAAAEDDDERYAGWRTCVALICTNCNRTALDRATLDLNGNGPYYRPWTATPLRYA